MKPLKWILKSMLALLGGIVLIALASLIVLSYQYDPPAPDADRTVPVGQKLAPAEMRFDLEFLMNTLEEVHPDLYASVSRDSIDRHRARIAPALADSLPRTDYYELIAPLVARLEDGHTGISTPFDEFSRFREEGGLAFPYTVQYETASGLTVETAYTDRPATGDRILEINGMSADSLFRAMRGLMSGKQLTFRDLRAARSFRGLLWIMEVEPPYTIRYRRPGEEQIRTAVVEGISRDDIIRMDSLRTGNATAPPPYRYELLPDRIGYIDFRSMYDEARFARFLEETFGEIREQAPAGLIIDLRNNGGGNSRLGNQLLDYLNSEPYHMSGGKAWLMSAQYRQHMRNNISPWVRWVTAPPAIWLVRIFVPEARIMTVPAGETVMLESTPTVSGPNPLRYDGKVCFLIGGGTFSSAMMLANAVEDYEIATLIGQETGGIPNHFGELYTFPLPYSGLSIFVSSAKFIRANGDAADPNPVQPDIRVDSGEGGAAGTDLELETATRWVLQEG